MMTWELIGKIVLGLALLPVGLVFLGAAMVMCNGGAGDGFYGSRNPSFWRHIQMFFLVGVVTAIIFGLIGGLGWSFWKILQRFDFLGDWSVSIAGLFSVAIVVFGWYHGTTAYWNWRDNQDKAKADKH